MNKVNKRSVVAAEGCGSDMGKRITRAAGAGGRGAGRDEGVDELERGSLNATIE